MYIFILYHLDILPMYLIDIKIFYLSSLYQFLRNIHVMFPTQYLDTLSML